MLKGRVGGGQRLERMKEDVLISGQWLRVLLVAVVVA
jgi:hypothetical protein